MSDIIFTPRQASFQTILCLEVEQDTQFLAGGYFAFSRWIPYKKRFIKEAVQIDTPRFL